MLEKTIDKVGNKLEKFINKWDKVVRSMPVTLFLAIYSSYTFSTSGIESYLCLDEAKARTIVVLIAYMLSNRICMLNIKAYKKLKVAQFINFIIFLLILVM